MDRFDVFIDRGTVSNEMYVIGLIHGLIFGTCAIPCETTLWDCEVFTDFVMIPVHCTEDRVEKTVNLINSYYPGICNYRKVES